MSRLAKELVKVRKSLENHGGNGDNEGFLVDMAPVEESDLTQWYAIIHGPEDTPYTGYRFKLEVKVPDTYPMAPPQVKFVADSHYRIPPHCNVDRTSGEICLDILKQGGWSPIWDLLHVIQAVHILLQEPEPDSPLDVDMAQIARSNDKSALYGIISYYLNE